MAQAGPSPRAPAWPARRMPASRGARPSSSAPTALPPATPRAPRHGRPPCWASPTRAQSSGGAAQGDASVAVRGASRRRARARPPVLPARSAPRARMTLAAPGWGPCTPPFECTCASRALALREAGARADPRWRAPLGLRPRSKRCARDQTRGGEENALARGCGRGRESEWRGARGSSGWPRARSRHACWRASVAWRRGRRRAARATPLLEQRKEQSARPARRAVRGREADRRRGTW